MAGNGISRLFGSHGVGFAIARQRHATPTIIANTDKGLRPACSRQWLDYVGQSQHSLATSALPCGAGTKPTCGSASFAEHGVAEVDKHEPRLLRSLDRNLVALKLKHRLSDLKLNQLI